jgi:hypothetical protein
VRVIRADGDLGQADHADPRIAQVAVDQVGEFAPYLFGNPLAA